MSQIIDYAAGVAVSDHKAKITGNDTNEGYLQAKLISKAGGQVTVEKLNAGANEQLAFDINASLKLTSLVIGTEGTAGSMKLEIVGGKPVISTWDGAEYVPYQVMGD